MELRGLRATARQEADSADFPAGLENGRVSGYTKVNIGLKESYIAG
jgi:hypothetical protein